MTRLEPFVDELMGSEDGAAQRAALTVEMLGRRIGDYIGSEFERSLQERRGEHVVDHHHRPGFMSQCAHCADVDQLLHRVGWRFEEHRCHRIGER